MQTPIWDPQQYLRHSRHRTRPFHDLLARVPRLPSEDRAPRIADLGCGPGNVTVLLADRWPTARITGFDNSAEMLEQAAEYAGATPGGGSIDFRSADLADWTPQERYDLIVTSATLQWVPGHTAFFPAWIDALTPGGTFALQVPSNFSAPTHVLLGELWDSPRWRERLPDRRRQVDVPDSAEYLDRLADLGCETDVWETTYLQLLQGEEPVFDWVKGTALRPVLTALADDEKAREEFLAEYRERLRKAYPAGQHGTVLPFRRIFAVGRRSA
ncbi:trans-aconitate 2-methyltransferase [Streptomyces sp. TP-A0874]|uniref:trans-aconitate 2-methyltransferase n=1 Tax=Streptomyces sp. TP-A0874 TaxID=549819 RepID=UPI000852D075|nr:trans-aconitate 2-methyltransferase [Streptomyces sp. TP-A0874]